MVLFCKHGRNVKTRFGSEFVVLELFETGEKGGLKWRVFSERARSVSVFLSRYRPIISSGATIYSYLIQKC